MIGRPSQVNWYEYFSDQPTVSQARDRSSKPRGD